MIRFSMRRSLTFVIVILALCGRAVPGAEDADATRLPASPDRGAAATPESTAPGFVVRVSADHALGSPTAMIAIVEFGDYQCPYCRAFHTGTFVKLRSAYIDTGKARYFYKDFPLTRIHAHAFSASVAAYCAGAQRRFWQMQDLLYANQARLGDALYAKLARDLKLDGARFDVCSRSPAARAAVYRDFKDGRRLRITGTPTFLLGRVDGDSVIVERIATGTPAFDVFARELDALARRVRARK